MNKTSRLAICSLAGLMVSVPLIDILVNIEDLNGLGILSVVIILIILITLWIGAALWFFVEWHDSFN